MVMISGHGTIETAVEATRRGAYDFLEKPLDTDRILLLLRNALQQRGLLEETLPRKKAKIVTSISIMKVAARSRPLGTIGL